MMKKLEELIIKKETPDFVNLLSLDGGGIRGLVIIQVIVFHHFLLPLCKCFFTYPYKLRL